MRGVDFDTVTGIIREVADRVILPRFRNLQAGDIAFKVGDDPVTIADKEAEKELSTRLLDLLPGSKVVGEEAFAENPGVFESFSGESPVWIIDPIDGTRNFVKGSSDFGVIVALAKQNQTIAGWIYDPTSKEVVTAEKGGGAWFKGHRLKVLPPTALSKMQGFLGDSILSLYEKSSVPNQLQPVFYPSRVGAHEYPRLFINGPHFGKTESPTHFRANLWHTTPWDDAGGVLMHAEAGGYAATWDGSPYELANMHTGIILAPDRGSWHELKNWFDTFNARAAVRET